MDKIDQQIIESIISVVTPDTTDTDQLVMEYLEGYFGGELNESTSGDDIVEAFANLLETADAVAEFMDINEISDKLRMKVARRRMKQAGHDIALRDIGRTVKTPVGDPTRHGVPGRGGRWRNPPKNPKATVGSQTQIDHRKAQAYRRAAKTMRAAHGTEKKARKVEAGIIGRSARSMAKLLRKNPEHRARATDFLKKMKQ